MRMLDRDTLQTVSTLGVTILLIAFAVLLILFTGDDPASRATADTLGTMIVGAVIARWLQQGANHEAEKTAEKLQQAVSSASTNGSTTTGTMDVVAEGPVTVKEAGYTLVEILVGAILLLVFIALAFKVLGIAL